MRRQSYLVLALSVCATLAVTPVAVYGLDPVVVPDIDLNRLPGTYAHESGGVKHVVTFAADGTFKGHSFTKGQRDDEYEGEWTAKWGYMLNPILRYTYTKSRRIPSGTKDEDTIIVLNDTALTVLAGTPPNLARRVWWRVAAKQ